MPREYRHQDKTMDADHLPTPDPTSPCGATVAAYPCLMPKETHPSVGLTGHDHPHVPTLCTCGHPIEKAPRPITEASR